MDYRNINLTPMYDITRTNDHKYFVEGRMRPSVTQIIHSQLGIEYYHDTDFYKERGSEVDRCIGLLIDGNLDWDSLDDRIVPYLKQFDAFLQTSRFQVLAHNLFVYHPELHYAGEFDLIGIMESKPDQLVEIDLKVGSKMPHYALQTGMYGSALKHTFRQLRDLEFHELQRFCLYLKVDKYKLDSHKNTATDYAYGRAVALAHMAKGIYK